jgi:hypothetical protein
MSGIHLAFLGSSFQAAGATETTVEYLVIAGGGGGIWSGAWYIRWQVVVLVVIARTTLLALPLVAHQTAIWWWWPSVESAFTATFGTAYTVTAWCGRKSAGSGGV